MKLILLLLLTLPSLVFAADIPALKRLFETNYNTFYQPRLCGKNIERLIKEAHKQKIDLSNSYALRIEGAGFLNTSGFYTRGKVNDRAMLGYFHYVLVADGYVFDFDLDEPLVLKLPDYVRLQFTPPYLPFRVFGINYDPVNELKYWSVKSYEWNSYISPAPKTSWEGKMDQMLDLKQMMARDRIR